MAAKKKTAAKKAPAAKKGAKKKTAAKRQKVSRAAKPVAAKRGGDILTRLRAICLSLPETHEVEAWGAPTFRVKNKIFAMHAEEGNSHGGRPAIWMLSISLEQDLVIRSRPDRYFKPPYVGPNGWIGAWLDKNPPWGEIEELLREAWVRRAPAKTLAQWNAEALERENKRR
jgi:hypothetical protein